MIFRTRAIFNRLEMKPPACDHAAHCLSTWRFALDKNGRVLVYDEFDVPVQV